MRSIREFCNADLPGLTRVWSEHWESVGMPPAVSAAIIDRAILSRTFFHPSDLIVAENDGHLQAWAYLSRPSISEDPRLQDSDDHLAVVSAICFTQEGLGFSDQVLAAAEQRARDLGCTRLQVGLARDQMCGFAGLPPVGHGIGVPEDDMRVASLLSRQGYSPENQYLRMAVTTAPYRPPTNRTMMQFRRTTRAERSAVVPQGGRYASAMSHLDIEHYQLINHRTGEHLANARLWLSDPEAQVMSCSEAILDLTVTETPGQLTDAERFLVSALVQSLATRCVFRVETAIDASHRTLESQLSELVFSAAGRGQRWVKPLT